MITIYCHDYNTWRQAARKLIQENVPPDQIIWNGGDNQISLFPEQITLNPATVNIKVSKEFLKKAEIVCYHRSEERFSLLYQMLWKLTYENKHLLKILSDPLTHRIDLMIKSIKRDVHKTKAFVRFKKTYDEDKEEHFIAWHKPDHYSLELSASFFVRRFAEMRWTILTPDQSIHWDKKLLHFGSGAKLISTNNDDATEELWKEFYRAIFNPARIKIKAMKKEMPVRHWATLPEAAIIPNILAEAPQRVRAMMEHQEGYAYSATDFIPKNSSLKELKDASKHCQGCPLYKNATQTVFGIGSENASIVLVGEQPGDKEDKAGQPFIGPAGQVLNQALIDAGLDRSKIYLTNAVKHFKFEFTQSKRLHRSPNINEIINCKPWLEAELHVIQPKLIVCLGVTAARSLISLRFKQSNRGQFITKDNFTYFSTYHPSAVLRSQELSKEIYNTLVEDLKTARLYLT